MPANNKVMEQDNINGVPLTLKVDRRKGSPKSKYFTISYKNKESKSHWPKVSLFFAIIFNILVLYFVRISLTVNVIIVIVLSVLAFFYITRSVQSESVLIIPSVGIQSSVKYVYGREDSFVPWSSVDDIIINEMIIMNRVLYFLTLLVKGTNQDRDPVKLMPLFQFTKPRLLMVEAVYREVKSLLSEAQRQGFMDSGDNR